MQMALQAHGAALLSGLPQMQIVWQRDCRLQKSAGAAAYSGLRAQFFILLFLPDRNDQG
ncbi:hypothetical protein DLM_0527 [Aquitalea magnusonii]|jgi:hypothetical protein|uniref:Uncharacterized protein n=1 Tax=Aquitalea magnusonii TaxID=332411 RepID=A0A3G9G845_9NEIS|nr:hypothetical protein DLM_0527 [Aquitalea magnusonii]